MMIAGKTGRRSPSTIVGHRFTKLVGKGREIRYGVLIIELDSGHGSGFRFRIHYFCYILNPHRVPSAIK